MNEPIIAQQLASDGYSIHVVKWPCDSKIKAHVVVIHGVQSHGGWYHNLGRTLSAAGYETHFPDRRGSGANRQDRGHTPHSTRLVKDLAEYIQSLKNEDPKIPVAVVGISWGGKLAVLLAGQHPELVDATALICPGLHPRVGVSVGERIRIALAFLFNKRKTFAIPLSDPALFTDNKAGQEFIANDPLGLHAATASMLAASTFIDLAVKKMPRLIHQPILLMLAGRDRIVNNTRTLTYFETIASNDRRIIDYPEGGHTLEFEDDPNAYAKDLVAWLDCVLG